MRRALVFLLVCCAAAFGVSTAAAAPADLDRSFGGGDGIAEIGASLPAEAGGRMAIGPDDEIYVLYSDPGSCGTPFNCTVSLTVARFTPAGQPDPSFATSPQLVVTQNGSGQEFDLAVGADGKPVIAAIGAAQGGLNVVRLGLDGRLDGSFGSGGVARFEAPAAQFLRSGVPAVAVQADGKVLAAIVGMGDAESGGGSLIVARYLADGALDPGFGEAGAIRVALPTQGRPAGVFAGADGSVTVPGPLCCFGGTPMFGQGFSVTRLGASGQLDPGWALDGTLFFPTPGAEATVQAATPASGGGLFLSYEASGPTSSTIGNVVKLTVDGALDTSFGSGGQLRLFDRVGAIDPKDLAVDRSDRLVGVGWMGRLGVFRLRPDGGVDRTFNGGERAILPYGGGGFPRYMVDIQSSGRIVAFGDSGLGGGKRFGLIALRGGTDRSRCLGKKATIVGTQRRDELTGTPRRDVIAALGGNDEVRALGGADLICGGKGKDKLLGGPGRDLTDQDPGPKAPRGSGPTPVR